MRDEDKRLIDTNCIHFGRCFFFHLHFFLFDRSLIVVANLFSLTVFLLFFVVVKLNHHRQS